ncbi:hypothetical protein V8C26DRAFT_45338 [Trichoderma gracile]
MIRYVDVVLLGFMLGKGLTMWTISLLALLSWFSPLDEDAYRLSRDEGTCIKNFIVARQRGAISILCIHEQQGSRLHVLGVSEELFLGG